MGEKIGNISTRMTLEIVVKAYTFSGEGNGLRPILSHFWLGFLLTMYLTINGYTTVGQRKRRKIVINGDTNPSFAASCLRVESILV